MYRNTLRTASSSLARAALKQPATRRSLTTAPPHQTSRSWKNSALRWGLAGGLVYYYNTSSAFAEEPAYAVHAPPETSHETETFPSIDTIAEQRKAQPVPQDVSSSTQTASTDAEGALPGSPEGLEEEAGQQGAFNEETGEINWECPCLGGMAHGPCGEQFRAAFSCFVYSKDEPKGVDCIEHFKTMQGCFREHPDMYGAELDIDEEDASPAHEGGDAAPTPDTTAPTDSGLDKPGPKPQPIPTPTPEEPAKAPTLANATRDGPTEKVNTSLGQTDTDEAIAGKTQRAEAATAQVQRDHGTPTSESPKAVPRAAHDAR
ncbi:Oxidoreductase [Elasticomyces elasticus]|nr:Oxidoreductase [Elasticomyces elasticus]